MLGNESLLFHYSFVQNKCNVSKTLFKHNFDLSMFLLNVVDLDAHFCKICHRKISDGDLQELHLLVFSQE